MTEAMSNTISNESFQDCQVSNLEPQTPTEKTLAQIWGEFFNVSDVTVDSDFFALGGNSLTVIKLLTRVQDAFGEDLLSPDTVFENGQLAQMAASIDSASSVKQGVVNQG